MKERVPAVEGWFTLDDQPRLVGARCGQCATVVFPPPALAACPNPSCDGTGLEPTTLSATGTVWSYTVNHYAPPAPYVAPDPFVPYAVAAVELAEERMVILGQVAGDPDALRVGAEAELVLDTLFEDDEREYVVWKWKVAS
jgi:uncharacterized OB-fold protein